MADEKHPFATPRRPGFLNTDGTINKSALFADLELFSSVTASAISRKSVILYWGAHEHGLMHALELLGPGENSYVSPNRFVSAWDESTGKSREDYLISTLLTLAGGDEAKLKAALERHPARQFFVRGGFDADVMETLYEANKGLRGWSAFSLGFDAQHAAAAVIRLGAPIGNIPLAQLPGLLKDKKPEAAMEALVEKSFALSGLSRAQYYALWRQPQVNFFHAKGAPDPKKIQDFVGALAGQAPSDNIKAYYEAFDRFGIPVKEWLGENNFKTLWNEQIGGVDLKIQHVIDERIKQAGNADFLKQAGRVYLPDGRFNAALIDRVNSAPESKTPWPFALNTESGQQLLYNKMKTLGFFSGKEDTLTLNDLFEIHGKFKDASKITAPQVMAMSQQAEAAAARKPSEGLVFKTMFPDAPAQPGAPALKTPVPNPAK